MITSRPAAAGRNQRWGYLRAYVGQRAHRDEFRQRWSKMPRNWGKLSSMTEADSSGDTQYRRFLREFLYVDVGRVRSYLAQLTEGLPERVSEASEEGSTTDTGLKVSGLGVDRAAIRATRSEETRTYGDLLVTLFEEHAESAGFLADLTGEVERADDWHNGIVHQRLEPGTLFRWTGLTRLFDAAHMAESVRRFENIVDAVTKLHSGPQSVGGKSGRTTQPPTKPTGLDPKTVRRMTEPIRDLLGNLLAGGVGLRMLACGPARPECGFGGILLDRSEYIESERAALFSRFGFEPTHWTVIASVSRIPAPRSGPTATTFDPSAVIRDEGSIDRGRLEEMALQMLSLFEGIGLTEAPVWPSIAVTPLAVYRTVGSSFARQ